MRTKPSSYYGTLILCSLIGCMVSCVDDEAPFVSSPLEVSAIQENLDAEGTLTVRASFSTQDPDTITEVGFVYTDAIEGTLSLRHGDATTLKVNGFTVDEEKGGDSYIVEASINPTRISPEFFDNTYNVNVAAYVISSTGKISVSPTRTFAWDKIRLLDVYPRRVVAGAVVTGLINRNFHNNNVVRENSDNGTEAYNVDIFIGDKKVAMDSSSLGNAFYFTMPAGVPEDAPMKIRIGNYEYVYEKQFNNAERSFEFITELRREQKSGYFVFAMPGALYVGGGIDKATDNTLTDFWKFDLATKKWSRIANYPADGRADGMAFTIGNFAYCGFPQNLKCYNQTTNTWTTVADPTGALALDNTFSTGVTLVYQDRCYFMDFKSTKVLNGIYFNNFFQFSPSTQQYNGMPVAYPGGAVSSLFSTEMDKGVLFDARFHFFRSRKHWRYDPLMESWTQLGDVLDGREVKAFAFKNNFYGIVSRTLPYPRFGIQGTALTLYKYDQDFDSWTLDADVPRIVDEDIGPFEHVFQILPVSENEVYLCLKWTSTYKFYRIK